MIKPLLQHLFTLLLISLCITCGKSEKSINIVFEARATGKPVSCIDGFSLSGHNRTFYLKDLRFYISDITLTDAKQHKTALKLEQKNNPWQYQNITLLDFSEQLKPCNDTQTGNTTVSGIAPNKDYHSIEFTLGVPFNLNHQEPAFSQSPLNIGSLFWSWQMGYKFLRLDLTDTNNHNWFFHLGSTACRSPSMVRAPTICERPNRVRVRLDQFNPKKNRIILNLDTLLKTAKLIPASKCMSNINEDNDCRTIFTNLGLKAETGHCLTDEDSKTCPGQTVFTHED